MKTVYATPGKYQVVRSVNGCTVSQTLDDGQVITDDVPAGESTAVFAFASKLYIDDDSAVAREVFKLAPQQKLAILGVLGGNASGLPAGYKRVEYLESPGGYVGSVGPHVILPIQYDAFSDVLEFETCHEVDVSTGNQAEGSNVSYAMLFYGCRANGYTYFGKEDTIDSNEGIILNGPPAKGFDVYKVQATPQKFAAWLNGTLVGDVTVNPGLNFELKYVSVFAARSYKTGQSFDYPFNGKKKYFKLWLNGELIYHLIPALDPTGAPCMFDIVSKTPFYNAGTGDFTYPTKSSTFALRRVLPDWGKLTEHGLRRLYHAPSGYKGEMYDYALENGFKPIVEPEKPEIGYWSPRWTETADEIVLEWIETEPPTDELGLPAETLTETE